MAYLSELAGREACLGELLESFESSLLSLLLPVPVLLLLLAVAVAAAAG